MGHKKRKPPSDTQPAPRLRALEKEQPQLPTSSTTGTKGSTKPCRFYLSDEGCRRGKACRFERTMKDLSKAERRDRCYECGGKGHLATACPTKKEPQQKLMNANDSPQSSTGGTSGSRKGQQGPIGGTGKDSLRRKPHQPLLQARCQSLWLSHRFKGSLWSNFWKMLKS